MHSGRGTKWPFFFAQETLSKTYWERGQPNAKNTSGEKNKEERWKFISGDAIFFYLIKCPWLFVSPYGCVSVSHVQIIDAHNFSNKGQSTKHIKVSSTFDAFCIFAVRVINHARSSKTYDIGWHCRPMSMYSFIKYHWVRQVYMLGWQPTQSKPIFHWIPSYGQRQQIRSWLS